jgi:hypothetical protein
LIKIIFFLNFVIFVMSTCEPTVGRGEREVRSNLGISFLQRGMERDMGEVGLG